MPTGWSRVLVLLALVVAFALAFAPAALVDARIARATGDRLRLADARGFWWRGTGVVATADGRARVPVAWRADMPELLRGALAVSFPDAADGVLAGTLTANGGVTTMRDIRATIPAASIAALDRRLDIVALGGNVTLDVPAFAWSTNAPSGNLRARWERAGVVVNGASTIDLGTVSLDMRAEAGRLGGTIRNAAGNITVEGTLAIGVNAIDVALTLRPTATAPEDVRSAVASLGIADGAGGVRIEFHERP